MNNNHKMLTQQEAVDLLKEYNISEGFLTPERLAVIKHHPNVGNFIKKLDALKSFDSRSDENINKILETSCGLDVDYIFDSLRNKNAFSIEYIQKILEMDEGIRDEVSSAFWHLNNSGDLLSAESIHYILYSPSPHLTVGVFFSLADLSTTNPEVSLSKEQKDQIFYDKNPLLAYLYFAIGNPDFFEEAKATLEQISDLFDTAINEPFFPSETNEKESSPVIRLLSSNGELEIKDIQNFDTLVEWCTINMPGSDVFPTLLNYQIKMHEEAYSSLTFKATTPLVNPARIRAASFSVMPNNNKAHNSEAISEDDSSMSCNNFK